MVFQELAQIPLFARPLAQHRRAYRRELDVAVARRVFGHEVEERVNNRTGEKDVVYRVAGESWLRVPFYRTSLAASVQIALELC